MRVFILDFFNLIKRYTYSYNLSDFSEGEIIDNLTYNILNKLCDIISINKPDIIFICSDSGRNKRAIAITKGEYKSNRKRNKTLTEEEKEHDYIEYLKTIISTLPFPFISVKDTEADMLIYCLSDYLKKIDNNIHITLLSSDSDFIQLLDKNIDIYDWYKDKINIDNWYTKHTKFNGEYFNAKNYALAKAITGDTSDNIKGINNIGWGKTRKLFNFINKYNGDIVIDNAESLLYNINNILSNENSDIDKKDINFLKKFSVVIEENKKVIKNNQSLIDLSMIETPYVYQIQNAIKRSILNNVEFDRKYFMQLLKLDRYKDNVDNAEYEKIIAKNSKSSIVFMQMSNKINNNLKILRNKGEIKIG